MQSNQKAPESRSKKRTADSNDNKSVSQFVDPESLRFDNTNSLVRPEESVLASDYVKTNFPHEAYQHEDIRRNANDQLQAEARKMRANMIHPVYHDDGASPLMTPTANFIQVDLLDQSPDKQENSPLNELRNIGSRQGSRQSQNRNNNMDEEELDLLKDTNRKQTLKGKKGQGVGRRQTETQRGEEVDDQNLIQQDGANPGNEEEKEDFVWWPMTLGEQKVQTKNELESLLEMQDKDHDVYPMSIEFTEKERKMMVIYKLVTLVLIVYFFIPLDVYIHTHIRIGYWGTDYYKETYPFANMVNNTFYFSAQNCKVYFDQSSTKDESMYLKYGFLFGTPHERNSSYLGIKSIKTKFCIINVYLPFDTPLPQLIFNFTGSEGNILLDDSNLNGLGLNFSNGLTIQGDTSYVSLSNHTISTLTINLLNSFTYVYSSQITYKNVTIIQGLYSEHINPVHSKVYLQITQPSGLICLSAPQINTLNNCANNTSSCTISAYLCLSSSSSSCSNTGSPPSQTGSVTVIDGPVQMRYPEAILNPANFTPASFPIINGIAINAYSNSNLNFSAQQYLKDSNIDRVSMIQTVGVDYQRTWAYTNKEVYFQSQFWTIIWSSITLLLPFIDNNKVVIIDSQCPARTISFVTTMDSDVNNFLNSYYPQTSYSQVAIIFGFSQFFQVWQNVLGDTYYTQILLNDNPILIVALAVAVFIALMGALLCVNLTYMIRKVLLKQYQEWIKAQKAFSITKKQAAASNSKGIALEESIRFDYQSQEKIVERRFIFYSYFDIVTTDDPTKQRQFKFSIFQIPTLYIDYLIRRQADSLKHFLLRIKESDYHFTKVQGNVSYKEEPNILVSDFEKLYSDFCQKQGYKEINFERDGEEVFKFFGLSFENQEGQEKQAYTNIRFKTNKEKGQRVGQPSQQNNVSTISQFLNEECVYTQFATDYILFDDIKKSYLSYCYYQGKSQSQIEQIIGSQELKTFGAVVRKVPPPKRIAGIKVDYDNGKSLVRIPTSRTYWINNTISKMLTPQGFLVNCVQAASHVVLILVIPLLTPVITFLALSTQTYIREGLNAETVFLRELYNANYLDPWWYNLPNVKILIYADIIVFVYLVFAIIELISYYLTSHINNGKYPVVYSFRKKLVVNTLLILIGIFIFFYYAMFWFILVWAILAAVINPLRFLPYAVASVTLFTTITVKFVYYKTMYQKYIRDFDKIIQDKLTILVEQSVAKLKRMTKEKLEQMSLPVGNDIFQREIKDHFDQIFDSTSLVVAESLKEGNINSPQALAKIASAALNGLQINVIEFCIGIITRNNALINDSLKKIAAELNVDYGLLESVSEIVLNEYNPDLEEQNELLGQVEIQIKKFFRKLLPTLNVEPLGDLLYVIVKGDPQRLIYYIDEIEGRLEGQNQKDYQQICGQLLKCLIYYHMNDKENVKLMIMEFFKQITSAEYLLQKQARTSAVRTSALNALQNVGQAVIKSNKISQLEIYRVFETLQNLGDGDISKIIKDVELLNNKNKTAKYINFKNNFPILFLVAFARRSSTFTANIIGQAMKEITNLKEMLSEDELKDIRANYMTKDQKQTIMEKAFLALYIISNGETMEMGSISKAINQKDKDFDGDIFNLIHLCSTNSPHSFQQIIYYLDYASEIDLLMEMYDIVYLKDVNPIQITSKLGIHTSQSKIFLNILWILYYVLKYELLCEKEKEKTSNKADEENGKDNSQQSRSKLFGQIKKKLASSVITLEDELGWNDANLKYWNSQWHNLIIDHPRLFEKKEKHRDGKPKDSAGNMSSEGSEERDDDSKSGESQITGQKNIMDRFSKDEEDNFGKHRKKILIFIKNAFESPSDKNYDPKNDGASKIWETINNLISNQLKYEPNALQIIRAYAFIILKNDLLIPQKYMRDFTASILKMGEILDIEFEVLDFLIDCISGHPTDLFKVFPKQPYYSLVGEEEDNWQIDGRIDNQRLNLLSDLLNADSAYLPYAFIKWYHGYRQFKASKSEIMFLVKYLNIKSEFYELMNIIRLNASKDHTDYDESYIQQEFRNYLNFRINSKINKQDTNQYNNDIADGEFINKPKYTQFTEELAKEAKDKRICLEIGLTKADQELDNKSQDKTFCHALQVLVKIKGCDLETLGRLLYQREGMNIRQNKGVLKLPKRLSNNDPQEFVQYRNVKILKTILEGVQSESDPISVLWLIYDLSRFVGLYEHVGGGQYSCLNKGMFIQLGLLMNALQFETLCYSRKCDKFALETILSKIVDKVDKNSNFKLGKQQLILQDLYQNGFFKGVSVKLFSNLTHNKLTEEQCNSILGMLFGATVNDLVLIRCSVMALLQGSQLNLPMLNGLAAAIINDISGENEIKYFCKIIDLDGQLLYNLIDLGRNQTNKLPQILYDLLSMIGPDYMKTCASLIHVLKGDIAMCKLLAQKISVEQKLLIPVLAAASGNFSILSEYYGELAMILDIDSQNTVQYVSELCHCKTQSIYSLSSIKSKRFSIPEPELSDAIFKVTYFGHQIMRQSIQNASQIEIIENSYTTISQKLCQQFEITGEEEKRLTKFISLIIPACWNDNEALKRISKKLRRCKGNDDSIWKVQFNSSEKKQGDNLMKEISIKFLKKKIRKIVEDVLLLQDTIQEKQRELSNSLRLQILPALQEKMQIIEYAKDNKKPVPKLKFPEQILKEVVLFKHQTKPDDESANENAKQKYDPSKKEKQIKNEIEALGKSDKVMEEIANIVGCTFGLRQYKKLNQPFYYCKPCNPEKNIAICLPCAILCHSSSDHQLVPGNYGKKAKMVCGCQEIKIEGVHQCKCSTDTLQLLKDTAVNNVMKDELQNSQKKNTQQKRIFINDKNDNYTTANLVADLEHAFNLPTYFDSQLKALKESENKNMTKLIEKKCLMPVEGTNKYTMLDKRLNICISLVQNIVLMAFGHITYSFLTILTNRKDYDINDFNNQSLQDLEKAKSNNNNCFRTMCGLLGIAQVDFGKIRRFGDTLAEAFNERGNSDYSAAEKISDIMRLSKGGKLPDYDQYTREEVDENHYLLLLKMIFPNKFKKVAALHILLQQSNKNLAQILGIDISKAARGQQKQGQNEIIRRWVDEELFNNVLQLDQKTSDYCKHVIGLFCQNKASLKFIMKKKGIPPHKFKMYKALMMSQDKDLQVLYESLKHMIPLNFSKFIHKVWFGEKSAVVKFILQYLYSVEHPLHRKWGKEFSETQLVTTPRSIAGKQKSYLRSIYTLMGEDEVNIEVYYKHVLYCMLNGEIYHKKQTDNASKLSNMKNLMHYEVEQIERIEHIERLAYCFKSIGAIFYNSILDVHDIHLFIQNNDSLEDKLGLHLNNKINNLQHASPNNHLSIDAKSFNALNEAIPLEPSQNPDSEDKPKLDILIKSLVNIVNKTWSNNDIRVILRHFDFNPTYSSSKEYIHYLRCVLRAAEGDLIKLGILEDEVFLEGTTHIYSLFASMITGGTKFDFLLDQLSSKKNDTFDFKGQQIYDPEAYVQCHKNLLIREMYRVFAKIVRHHYNLADPNKPSANIKESSMNVIPNLDINRQPSSHQASHKQNLTNQNEKVNNFIDFCFKQKIPLYLLMVISNNKTLIDKLFQPEKEFTISLATAVNVEENNQPNQLLEKTYEKKELNNIKYLDAFMDFVDPFTQNANIKDILKLVLERKGFNRKDKFPIQVTKIKPFEKFSSIVQTLNLQQCYVEKFDLTDINHDQDTQKEITQKLKTNRKIQIMKSLKEDLNIDFSQKDKISIDIIGLAKILSNCYQMDPQELKNLYRIFIRLFDDDPILTNVYTLIYKLVTQTKLRVFDHASAIVALILASTKKANLDERDSKIVKMIAKWMHCIAIMLDKENDFSSPDQTREAIQQALICTLDCFPEGEDNFLTKYSKDLQFLVDIIFGAMSAAKMDFSNIKSLALKMGGFPEIDKLTDFFYIIKKNKDHIGSVAKELFKEGFAVAQQSEAVNVVEDEIKGIVGMDPRSIFNYFSKKNQGKIGIEEFQELCKYMGLQLSTTQQLQIFSKVDLDKSGGLEFSSFLRCLKELKQLIILESIEKLGLSVQDLVRSFVMSIVILIMTFAFIFISIQAFASATTFSSVTNSMLPVIAGGAVNQSGQKDKDDNEIQDVVNSSIA